MLINGTPDKIVGTAGKILGAAYKRVKVPLRVIGYTNNGNAAENNGNTF